MRDVDYGSQTGGKLLLSLEFSRMSLKINSQHLQREFAESDLQRKANELQLNVFHDTYSTDKHT